MVFSSSHNKIELNTMHIHTETHTHYYRGPKLIIRIDIEESHISETLKSSLTNYEPFLKLWKNRNKIYRVQHIAPTPLIQFSASRVKKGTFYAVSKT